MTCVSLPSSCAARWCAFATAVALALACATAAGAAEETVVLYQWTDSKGVYRYTPDYDRIPASARHTVLTIQAGEGPPQETPIYFNPDPRSPVVAVPQPEPVTGTASAAPSGNPYDEYDDRIRELEARIAEYEEALKVLILAEGSDADTEVSPELREIAARLPRLVAELASLERGRARAGGP
jgi:hypothetical protein